MFVRVIPEPVIYEIPLLIFSLIKLSSMSIKTSLFIFFSYHILWFLCHNGIFPLLDIILDGRLNINPVDCILDNWVFENFILADKPLAKDLCIFETCALVNNNLCAKLVLTLELLIRFDQRLKATSVLFFHCRF